MKLEKKKTHSHTHSHTELTRLKASAATQKRATIRQSAVRVAVGPGAGCGSTLAGHDCAQLWPMSTYMYYSFHIPSLHLTKLTGSRCCRCCCACCYLDSVRSRSRSFVLFPADHLANQLAATFPMAVASTDTRCSLLDSIPCSMLSHSCLFVFAKHFNISAGRSSIPAALNEKHSLENPTCFCSGQV